MIESLKVGIVKPNSEEGKQTFDMLEIGIIGKCGCYVHSKVENGRK